MTYRTVGTLTHIRLIKNKKEKQNEYHSIQTLRSTKQNQVHNIRDRRKSEMKNTIVEDNKKEVASKRPAKTIKVVVLWQFIGTFIAGMIVGGFVVFYGLNAINSNIDNQVKTQVDAHLKTSK